MNLDFAKMHGLGNDFMVLDLVSQAASFSPDEVRCWADRRTGVGFDQLLIIEPPTDADADFRYRIYNADGSEAEQCGNGARCVAKLISDSGLSRKPVLRFETSTGFIETRLLDADQVEVQMGVPAATADAVPFDADYGKPQTDSHSWRVACPDSEEPIVLVPVSMGNPHGVLFVPEIAAVEVDWLGERLMKHRFFPQRANIGFCQIVDRGFIRLRVFERGVGETRACGTGACAAAVAGQLEGKLDERVKVSLPGGKVRIRWQGPGTPVRMTGPAALVYHGQIPLK